MQVSLSNQEEDRECITAHPETIHVVGKRPFRRLGAPCADGPISRSRPKFRGAIGRPVAERSHRRSVSTAGAVAEGCKPASCLLEYLYSVEDHLNHRVVTHRGVDHNVEVLARRPFHAEVLFDEGGTVEIDGFGKLNGFLLALPGVL